LEPGGQSDFAFADILNPGKGAPGGPVQTAITLRMCQFSRPVSNHGSLKGTEQYDATQLD
jgi:hypothetical protein